MYYMTNEADRLYRINKVVSVIRNSNERGNAADKEKLIAHFMIDYGISRRTSLEYLKALEVAEKIKITKEGEIWLN